MNPIPDPAIDEIREIRHRISANFDHDPAALVAYLMKFQEQFKDRLIYVPDEHPSAQAVPSDANEGGGSFAVHLS